MSANAAGVNQAVPDRRRRLVILGICSLSLLIVGLDATIVNIALPAIHRAFHSPLSGLQWTIDAYTLVIASFLMLSGSMADRLGRRRVFQCGLALFSFGSLLCGLAPNLGLLIAARVVQAIGGSMLNPVAMSIIRNVFEDPRERAQAIGAWGALFGISMALGPVLGGVLVDSVGWRSVFFVNLPIGIVAIALTALFVPESRAPRPRRPDPVGQVLVIVALATLTYAIIEGPRHGWGSPLIVGLFAVAGLALGGLVAWELRRTDPLVELRFFRSVPFTGATVTAVTAFAAFGAFLFLNSLYLQEVRGFGPLQAGLCTLPMAAAAFVLSPISGHLVGTRGVRLPLVTTGICFAIAAAVLTQLSPTMPLPVLLGAYLVFGVGFGMVNPAITNTAVSGMPRAQAGVAAAVASTSRQVGQSLGVAVSGSIAGAAAGILGPGFAAATRPVWWLIVGCGAVVVVLALVATTARARASTGRVASLFADDVPAPVAVPVPAA